jgi:hypothetical protein
MTCIDCGCEIGAPCVAKSTVLGMICARCAADRIRDKDKDADVRAPGGVLQCSTCYHMDCERNGGIFGVVGSPCFREAAQSRKGKQI